MQRRQLFLALIVTLGLIAASCSSSDNPADESPIPSTSADVDGGATEEASADVTNPPTEDPSVPATIEPSQITIRGTQQAPEFPAGLPWLNVERPLTIADDLAGKFVLLDFWTQGCINCIHIIPELKQLEEEYADSLVVVGVHWAKFDRERQTEAIRDSVVRYGVEHPVVNDEFEVIRTGYGVQAWPTIILIDPEGNILGGQSGEGVYDAVAPILRRGVPEWRAAGLLNTTALATVLETEAAAPTVLSFPGKVLADERTDRLFVADTGHHRVLVSDLAGALDYSIGSGIQGFVDGSIEEAQFSRPQGMALSEDGATLYIADRENHAIRAVDLASRMVTTIAGTGSNTFRVTAGVATEVDVSSPWDLHLWRDQLYVAGAGRHQLYVVDLTTGILDIFAGTGGEGIDDGPRLETTLSQPSGFADDGEFLYFTDPEASAIRRLPLDGTGNLETIVGDGLFSWGDATGTFEETSLQHAVGIEFHNDSLIVADTYNHHLKVLDLTSERSISWLGVNESGYVDAVGDAARLAEPSGLSIAGNTLYVADTNNHQIRVVNLTSAEASTIAFTNLDVAALRTGTKLADQVELPVQNIGVGDTSIEIDFGIPDGYKWNTEGTFTMQWTSDGDAIQAAGDTLYEAKGPEVPVSFDVVASAGAATITIESTVFYCLDDNEAFCLIRDVTFVLPVEVSPGGTGSVLARHDLPSAERLASL